MIACDFSHRSAFEQTIESRRDGMCKPLLSESSHCIRVAPRTRMSFPGPFPNQPQWMAVYDEILFLMANPNFLLSIEPGVGFIAKAPDNRERPLRVRLPGRVC